MTASFQSWWTGRGSNPHSRRCSTTELHPIPGGGELNPTHTTFALPVELPVQECRLEAGGELLYSGLASVPVSGTAYALLSWTLNSPSMTMSPPFTLRLPGVTSHWQLHFELPSTSLRSSTSASLGFPPAKRSTTRSQAMRCTAALISSRGASSFTAFSRSAYMLTVAPAFLLCE